ncbi:Pkinase-domain-containing protein [Aureobasidium subglaciale]|nr:Pkinase-domain-containing protein [Aureobasidium subglaciale]
MATAAMHHIMPKLHIGSSRDKDGRKESRSEITANNRARDEEKSRLLAWEAQKQPLEYDQILVEPNSKPVGHSSKVLRREDFDLVKTLGTGTFARVWLANLVTPKKEDAEKVFALKILRKTDVIRLKQVEHVRNERNVLASVAGHPFITTMVASFQDQDTLYMLLEYCPGGEVFSYLRRARRFNESTSQFYAAEIVLILEFLHDHQGVAYRDLKPENILIDADGHLKLVDFGFAKKVENSASPSFSRVDRNWLTFFVLRRNIHVVRNARVSRARGHSKHWYVITIRESIRHSNALLGHGLAVDWWALGILIYEFLVGQPPFWDQNPMKIYEQIVEGKIRFPSAMSADARDLISQLCAVDVTKRLGNIKGGASAIKGHPWFKDIDWDAMYHRKMQGPIVPHLRSPSDTRNFDEYDPEPLHKDQYTKDMKEKYESAFKDF